MTRLMLPAARRKGSAPENGLTGWGHFIWIATVFALLYSIASPLVRLYLAVSNYDHAGQPVYEVIAVACYLPIQVWLVLSATRGRRGWPQHLGLAVMATVVLTAIPIIGVAGLANLYTLGALVLVIVRPPLSLLLYAALVATPKLVTSLMGHPEWGPYFTVTEVSVAIPLVAVIWMINVARVLDAARIRLAEQAVIQERLRIEDELRQTVGTGLSAITASGDRAARCAVSDPKATSRDLGLAVNTARQTLADARQIVRRYRDVSLRSELESAVALLAAAGIGTTLEVPTGELPGTVDETEREHLRRVVAKLLGEGGPRSVTIAIGTTRGQNVVELRTDTNDPLALVPSRRVVP